MRKKRYIRQRYHILGRSILIGRSIHSSFLLLAVILSLGCGRADNKKPVDLFDRSNLIAWCIVPFDASGRTPEERAFMLDEMGISRFAYDYRDQHIASFREEIGVLRKHGIELSAVWLWLEPSGDTLLNPSCRAILRILEETSTHTDLWISFPPQFFENMPEEEKISKGVDAIEEVLGWADAHGCTISLYNHGDWFGEPENQIRIIRAIGTDRVRMVYNFHHGHHQVERFEPMFREMLPYLSAVNINGMRVEGPKIITVGQGDMELEMLRVIKESGYRGPIGIIGHTEGEDIKVVLQRNMEGLEKLKKQL
jgi:sugar phosphate isomerase/epimerase